MSDLICHLQIAKAASNSTRYLMQENFPHESLEILKITERTRDGHAITVHSGIPEVKKGIERIVEREHHIGAISMMLSFGVHTYLQRSVRYFAFVREPIARALSALHFVNARQDTHPAAPHFKELEYRPSALIAEGNLLFMNDQVRIISGTDHFEVDASDLELAKQNIEDHFAFVGNSAALFECWPRLCELTGLKGDASAVRNKGQYSAELQLDAHEMDVLERANQYDKQLVDWVNDEYLPRHGIRLRCENHAEAGA